MKHQRRVKTMNDKTNAGTPNARRTFAQEEARHAQAQADMRAYYLEQLAQANAGKGHTLGHHIVSD